MYTRLLPTPTRSVFLLGPRGTGKSTWIRDRFPGATTYDLFDQMVGNLSREDQNCAKDRLISEFNAHMIAANESSDR